METGSPSAAIELRELTPDRLEDWLAFFDHDAFPDNPEWGTCYCRCFLFEGSDEAWDEACEQNTNRAVMAERIQSGLTTGILAYEGETLVGWCHFGARGSFCRSFFADLPLAEAEGVAAVVCFVVTPGLRRQGVARALLKGVCELAVRRGFRAVEGYPALEEPEPGDAEQFPGPASLFAEEGFEPAGQVRHRAIVRKTL